MSTRFDKVLAEDAPAPDPKPKRFPVVAQKWEERERGWGRRPDGWTMHLTLEDRDHYVRDFHAKFNTADEAPDEYTTTSGDPYVMDVDEETYAKVQASDKHGIWGDGNMPPAGKQGRNGFVSMAEPPKPPEPKPEPPKAKNEFEKDLDFLKGM